MQHKTFEDCKLNKLKNIAKSIKNIHIGQNVPKNEHIFLKLMYFSIFWDDLETTDICTAVSTVYILN